MVLPKGLERSAVYVGQTSNVDNNIKCQIQNIVMNSKINLKHLQASAKPMTFADWRVHFSVRRKGENELPRLVDKVC